MNNRNSGAMVGAGLVAGLAIGVALGFLYAPQSGKKTRAILKKRAVEIQEAAGEMAEDIRERAGSMMDMAKERMHVGGDSHI
jgi:gas vesicle protein